MNFICPKDIIAHYLTELYSNLLKKYAYPPKERFLLLSAERFVFLLDKILFGSHIINRFYTYIGVLYV